MKFRIGIASLLFMSVPSIANAQSNEVEDKDPLEVEAEQLELEVRRQTAINNLERLRREQIAGIGLPSNAGTRKLEGDAGQGEAAILSSFAFEQIAITIVGNDDWQGRLILAEGEPFPGDLIENLLIQQSRTAGRLASAENACAHLNDGAAGANALAVLPVIAGLLRSNVTYSGLDTPGVDSSLFADILATYSGASRPNGFLPIAPTSGSVPFVLASRLNSDANKASSLRQKLVIFANLSANEKKETANALCSSSATSALADYDKFFTAWFTPDSQGRTPAGKALDWMNLLNSSSGKTQVLVVGAQVFGTSSNRSDITTFFGSDPLRVSAQIIVRIHQFEVEIPSSITTNFPHYKTSSSGTRLAYFCATDAVAMNRFDDLAVSSNPAPRVNCRSMRARSDAPSSS